MCVPDMSFCGSLCLWTARVWAGVVVQFRGVRQACTPRCSAACHKQQCVQLNTWLIDEHPMHLPSTIVRGHHPSSGRHSSRPRWRPRSNINTTRGTRLACVRSSYTLFCCVRTHEVPHHTQVASMMHDRRRRVDNQAHRPALTGLSLLSARHVCPDVCLTAAPSPCKRRRPLH